MEKHHLHGRPGNLEILTLIISIYMHIYKILFICAYIAFSFPVVEFLINIVWYMSDQKHISQDLIGRQQFTKIEGQNRSPVNLHASIFPIDG